MDKKKELPPETVKLTKEQQQKIAIQLRVHLSHVYPFLSDLIYSRKIRITDKRQSFTDGKTVVVSSFYLKYPKIGMKAIGAHELLHVALHHLPRFAAMTRSKNRGEQVLYNLLADARINEIVGKWAYQECYEEWVCMNHHLILPDNVDEQITMALFQGNAGWKQFLPQKGEELDYAKIDKTFNIIRNIKFPEGKGGKGSIPNPFSNPQIVRIPGGSGKGDGNGSDEPTLDEDPGAWEGDEEETKQTDQEVRGAIERGLAGSKMRGVGAGDLAEMINGVWNNPQISWTRILKNYIKSRLRESRTWGKLHKKSVILPQLMPGFKRKKLYKIMIGIDTSGSMSSDQLHNFLGEIYWLLKQNHAQAEVVMFDDGIRKKIMLERRSDIDKIREVEGRGGTSYTELFEYAETKRIKDLVVMTDGYGDQQSLKKPPFAVHWVVDNNHCKFDFGKIIQISFGD